MAFSPPQTNISLPQPIFTFAALSQSLVVPQYSIIPAASAGVYLTQWHHIGPFATSLPASPCRDPTSCSSETFLRSAPGGVTGAGTDPGRRVTVLALTGVNLKLSLVAPMGGCEAWQVYKPGVMVRYGRQVREPVGMGDCMGVFLRQGKHTEPTGTDWGVDMARPPVSNLNRTVYMCLAPSMNCCCSCCLRCGRARSRSFRT
jgi:hypothetical protein